MRNLIVATIKAFRFLKWLLINTLWGTWGGGRRSNFPEESRIDPRIKRRRAALTPIRVQFVTVETCVESVFIRLHGALLIPGVPDRSFSSYFPNATCHGEERLS